MIVAGGGVANFIALKAARDAMAGLETRQAGVREPLAIYCSEEAHVTVDRAADMLGLGTDTVRHVGADGLEEAIRADLQAGVRPGIIVGTAGTTSTGEIEPLPELAEIAARHGLWFHVDAAYGGALALSDELRPLLARDRARGFGHARPAQVAVDAARERMRRRARPAVPRRQLRCVRVVRARGGRARARSQPRVQGAAVQPRVRRAQGLGLAAGARPHRLRTPHRARHRADPLSGGPCRGAPGVRADRERPLDLLLPVPAAGTGRRGAAERAERRV